MSYVKSLSRKKFFRKVFSGGFFCGNILFTGTQDAVSAAKRFFGALYCWLQNKRRSEWTALFLFLYFSFPFPSAALLE